MDAETKEAMTNPCRFALGYILIALIVFGAAFNRDYRMEATPSETAFLNGARAVVSAVAWPLWLSKTAFEFLRKE